MLLFSRTFFSSSIQFNQNHVPIFFNPISISISYSLHSNATPFHFNPSRRFNTLFRSNSYHSYRFTFVKKIHSQSSIIVVYSLQSKQASKQTLTDQYTGTIFKGIKLAVRYTQSKMTDWFLLFFFFFFLQSFADCVLKTVEFPIPHILKTHRHTVRERKRCRSKR